MPILNQGNNRDLLMAQQLMLQGLDRNLARNAELIDRQAQMSNDMRLMFSSHPEKFSGAKAEIDRYGNIDYNKSAKKAMELRKNDLSQEGSSKTEGKEIPLDDRLLKMTEKSLRAADYDPLQKTLINKAMEALGRKPVYQENDYQFNPPSNPKDLDYLLPNGSQSFAPPKENNYFANPFMDYEDLNIDDGKKLLPEGQYMLDQINKGKYDPKLMGDLLQTPGDREEQQKQSKTMMELLLENPELITEEGLSASTGNSSSVSGRLMLRPGSPGFEAKQGYEITQTDKANIIDEAPYRLDDLFVNKGLQDIHNVVTNKQSNVYSDMATQREAFLKANMPLYGIEKTTKTATPPEIKTNVTSPYVDANISEKQSDKENFRPGGSGGGERTIIKMVGFADKRGRIKEMVVGADGDTFMESGSVPLALIDFDCEKEAGFDLLNGEAKHIKRLEEMGRMVKQQAESNGWKIKTKITGPSDNKILEVRGPRINSSIYYNEQVSDWEAGLPAGTSKARIETLLGGWGHTAGQNYRGGEIK